MHKPIHKLCEIQGSCYLMFEQWTDDYKYVQLNYTNETTDHYHSSYEVNIDIDKATAIDIIAFLKESFNLE